MPVFSAARLRVLAVAALVAGCDSSAPPPDAFAVTYSPAFAPASFAATVTNPFFPLVPGTTFRTVGQTSGGEEVITVTVTDQTRVVAGVRAVVVRDRVTLAGALIEDTVDWFAQDAAGNVWYLGEQTAEYENGQVVNTNGSWEAGVNGAVAGIYMPAAPAAAQAYLQELARGEAEDRAVILRTGIAITVPTGSYTGCVETEDTTPLQPEVLERKTYCPGVGNVRTVDVPTGERFELTEVTRPAS